ncbi:helix-hairpin-helix domain-containing protein [Chloroflexi bacterium TSY]|nr:helix-hairpin-helix domain-containing protein [Chloroflexi bacterium TSY]
MYTPTALPEPDSFVASESVSGTSDNFTWIRGIGDAKEQRLHAAGYLTYDLFLNANVEELASLLDVSSSTVVRMMDAIQERKGDVSSWPVAVAVPVQGT